MIPRVGEIWAFPGYCEVLVTAILIESDHLEFIVTKGENIWKNAPDPVAYFLDIFPEIFTKLHYPNLHKISAYYD